MPARKKKPAAGLSKQPRAKKPEASNQPHVWIIGGGLAGMTAAKVLAENGMAVTIFEKGDHLGGKASSVLNKQRWEDHGFHCFPGWYRNTRALLRDLDAERDLVDVHRFHFLRKGEYPRFVTTYEFSSPTKILHNLFRGILPWDENLLSYYCLLDLACEPLHSKRYLDQISGTGFLRSRFYGTESVARLQHQTILQAAAIPAYECAASTLQNLFRAWMWWPSPLYSVLNGSLQAKFIGPLQRRLEELKVKFRFNVQVNEFLMQGNRVGALTTERSVSLPAMGSGDFFVGATPSDWHLGVAWLQADYKRFAPKEPLPLDVYGLQSVPMGALHFRLKRALKDLPKEHINLVGSRFGITLVDISRYWEGLKDPVINMVAARLPGASPDALMIDAMVKEFLEYFPMLRRSDIADEYLQTHFEQPLFINTVGSWENRPAATTSIENLFRAGDYCRTEADLATMESAVISGINAAAAVLKRAGKRVKVAPLEIGAPPLPLLQLAKYAALPLITPLAIWKRVQAGVDPWLHRSQSDD